MFIILIQNVLVYFHDDLMGQALTEQGQCTCIKRRLFLISGKANKVLQIGGDRNLFHKFTVRKQKFLLYDQRTQAIRKGFATFPVLLGKSSAYFSSKTSKGIWSARRIHLFWGFICIPSG